MNIVTAWGGTAKQRNLAEDIGYFCIEKLMPRMKTLDICIDFDIGDGEVADGYCYAETKREIIIQIDPKLKGDDFKTALMHELVHAKQFAKGELDINHRANYTTVAEYLDLWYEKEAYELQEVLLKQYKEQL